MFGGGLNGPGGTSESPAQADAWAGQWQANDPAH